MAVDKAAGGDSGGDVGVGSEDPDPGLICEVLAGAGAGAGVSSVAADAVLVIPATNQIVCVSLPATPALLCQITNQHLLHQVGG